MEDTGLIEPKSLLFAARADSIPEGESGLWGIKKVTLSKPCIAKHPRLNRLIELPPRTYTKLFRVTEATMHLTEGECVMEDTDLELRTHLDFMIRAKGVVLITGLGLGCVVRGCLANEAVRHIVCIEKSKDVLSLVGPHMPKDRLTIIYADALEWVKNHARGFDCAWHDIWSDESAGEPHLQLLHSRLMLECFPDIPLQGAWNFPRYERRQWRQFANVI